MFTKDYGASFSSDTFWKKIAKLSETAGCAILRVAFYLYFILTKVKTPPWVKAAIIAALGYFICPVDAIPDFLPGGIGYTDDLAIMLKLVEQLDHFIDDDIKNKVNKLLPERCRR